MALKENEFYCTKYAFTGGISKVIQREDQKGSNMFLPSGKLEDRFSLMFLKDDESHKTWSSAMNEVEKMRAAKIASLSKQMKKVQDKTFTEPE